MSKTDQLTRAELLGSSPSRIQGNYQDEQHQRMREREREIRPERERERPDQEMQQSLVVALFFTIAFIP